MHSCSHILELLIDLLPIKLINLVDHDLWMGIILIEIQHIHSVLISDVPGIYTHRLSVLLCSLMASVKHVTRSVEKVLGIARIGHLEMSTLLTVLCASHAI